VQVLPNGARHARDDEVRSRRNDRECISVDATCLGHDLTL